MEKNIIFNKNTTKPKPLNLARNFILMGMKVLTVIDESYVCYSYYITHSNSNTYDTYKQLLVK